MEQSLVRRRRQGDRMKAGMLTAALGGAAVEMANPELNVLLSDVVENVILVILAEAVPPAGIDKVEYVVAAYKLDKVRAGPDTLFWGIPTLDRARVVYEEIMRTF